MIITCRIFLFSFVFLICTTLLSHVAVDVHGKREMVVVDEIRAPVLLQNLQSSVIDTQNSAAYFNTLTIPGQVCKYNVSSTNFSLVACIAAPSGVNGFRSAVIDTQNSAAYFGTYDAPGQVCKYNISSANFSFVSCIAAPLGATDFRSGVFDTHKSAAYFGTYTTPGQVCKYNVSSSNFSFVSCVTAPSGANGSWSAVIDMESSAAYFGTWTAPGQVCKYNVSSTNFSLVTCIAAPSGVNWFRSAVIDTQNSAAYFGTQSIPGQVCKYNVSSTNFSLVACIAAPSGVNGFLSAVIDTPNSVAYFGTFNDPGQVCKYVISSANFSLVSCIMAPTGVGGFASAVIDTQNSTAYSGVVDAQNSVAYFGTYTTPSQVCKYNVSSSNFSFVSCIAVPLGEDRFLSAVIDPQNSAAYFGTYTNPGQVCKFNTSSTNFSLVSCIVAPSEKLVFRSGVIDPQNSAAYFGTHTIPGQVCKFNVSSASFSLVSCFTAAAGANYFISAVIDTKNSAAYFGSSTNPGHICQYNISSTNFSFVSCIVAPSGVNRFSSALIDTQNSAAYFGTVEYSKPGQVCKFNTSSARFALVSCIEAPSGANEFHSAVIDAENTAAYFGTYTSPGQVCKYNVSSANFSFVSCIAAPPEANRFISTVIDPQNSAAYFGTSAIPGLVCKFNVSSTNFSFVSCITAPSGANEFLSAVIDTQNSAAYFGTYTSPGRVVKLDLNAFACNSDGQLAIGHDDFHQSNPVNFVALKGCNVTISSVNVEQPITFRKSIGDSTIALRNITSTSTDSFVHLSSSTPFSSSSTFTFEENQFEGKFLLSSPSDVDLSHSSWLFKCNKWVNGYDNALKNFARQHNADQISLDCPRTLTASPSSTQNRSKSNSASLSASSTESRTNSRSASRSESLSSSVTPSNSIYCTTFDEVTCNTFPGQCKFCPATNICVELNQRCDTCLELGEQVCAFTDGRCKFCPEHQVCVNATTTPTCDCVDFSSSVCANSTCNYCSSESVCVPSQQSCGCINFTSTVSVNNSNAFCDASTTCHFCPQQQTCLPQTTPCTCHDMNQEQCDISFLSPQNDNSCKYCFKIGICAPKKIDCACMSLPDQTVCNVAGECHWCSNYSTCAPRDTWPDCNCDSLRSSDFCSVISNNNCQWCSNLSVCVDPKIECECEVFSKSICALSQCTWCDNINTCTVRENTNCECYYLKTEQKCSADHNDKCSWCSKSDPIMSYFKDGKHFNSRTFNVTDNFNYCVNKTTDRCECSYLSNDFCQYASSSQSSSDYSSTCKFCSSINLCTRQENTDCDCGQEYSPHGCNLSSSLCSFRPAILTVSEGEAYCTSSTASCAPVACQGIENEFACRASKCHFNNVTGKCDTEDCFYLFIAGFTSQPYLLYFFGLLKDIVVVLLVGAIGDYFTRPIMKIVFNVKKKIKNLNHIERRINDQTLYMSDKFCRDGYSFSFSEYVEQICEDVFEFVDEEDKVQILDEQHRLALFDITAFCLFDNMLWLEPVLNNENEKNTIVPKEREKTVINNPIHSLNNNEEPAAQKKENVAASSEREGNDQVNQEQKNDVPSPLPPTSARKQRGFSMKTPKSPNNDTYSPPNNDQVENSASNAAAAAAATPRNDESTLQAPPAPVFEVVQLSCKDFESLATLRSTVQETLLQRGSSFIYYAQSRNRIIAACAAINSFPTALQLFCYITVVSVLYISSLIAVSSFPSITQVVSGCNSFSPQDTGVTFFGAFLLLGFRLMNSSAEATSVLILVKTIRGFYQKLTGLHDLSLQQRIPLMGLFADRAIQATLAIYALVVLPFALAGPLYGGIKIDWRCWVPIFVGAGVVLINWAVLFGFRWYARKRRFEADIAKNEEEAHSMRMESLLELNNEEEESEKPPAASQHVRAAKDDDDEFEEIVNDARLLDGGVESEISLSTIVSSATRSMSRQRQQSRSLTEQHHEIDELLADQTTIESSAPMKLGKAILVFLMTEEFPVIAVSLALQVSFNYLCLLNFRYDFGIDDVGDRVYEKDYNDRKLHCVWKEVENDASTAMSMLTSFIPF